MTDCRIKNVPIFLIALGLQGLGCGEGQIGLETRGNAFDAVVEGSGNDDQDPVGEEPTGGRNTAAGQASCLTSGPFSRDKCSNSCKCDVKMADCDSDQQCNPGLRCGWNLAHLYMEAPDWGDICLPNYRVDWGHCSESNPCDVGAGDCDSDRDCLAGLVCRHNVGRRYRTYPSFDVCERPDHPANAIGPTASDDVLSVRSGGNMADYVLGNDQIPRGAYPRIVDVSFLGEPTSQHGNTFNFGAASDPSDSGPVDSYAYYRSGPSVLFWSDADYVGTERLRYTVEANGVLDSALISAHVNARTTPWSCSSGLVRCNGSCRLRESFQSDPQHCGSCNTACGRLQACISGRCQTPPITACAGRRVSSVPFEGRVSTLGRVNVPTTAYGQQTPPISCKDVSTASFGDLSSFGSVSGTIRFRCAYDGSPNGLFVPMGRCTLTPLPVGGRLLVAGATLRRSAPPPTAILPADVVASGRLNWNRGCVYFSKYRPLQALGSVQYNPLYTELNAGPDDDTCLYNCERHIGAQLKRWPRQSREVPHFYCANKGRLLDVLTPRCRPEEALVHYEDGNSYCASQSQIRNASFLAKALPELVRPGVARLHKCYYVTGSPFEIMGIDNGRPPFRTEQSCRERCDDWAERAVRWASNPGTAEPAACLFRTTHESPYRVLRRY